MCFQVWQSVSVLTWERKRKRSQEWWGAAPTRFRRPCEWILERNGTVRSFYRHQKPTCQSQEESIIYQDELFCCWRHRSHPGRRCQSPLSCTSWRLGCGTIRCFRWAKCHQERGWEFETPSCCCRFKWAELWRRGDGYDFFSAKLFAAQHKQSTI